jgi:hypothetical protein
MSQMNPTARMSRSSQRHSISSGASDELTHMGCIIGEQIMHSYLSSLPIMSWIGRDLVRNVSEDNIEDYPTRHLAGDIWFNLIDLETFQERLKYKLSLKPKSNHQGLRLLYSETVDLWRKCHRILIFSIHHICSMNPASVRARNISHEALLRLGLTHSLLLPQLVNDWRTLNSEIELLTHHSLSYL